MTGKNELRAEIEIDADPGTVWEVLTDFGAYPELEPVHQVDRRGPDAGGQAPRPVAAPGARGITMKPTVTVNEPGTAFGWLGTARRRAAPLRRRAPVRAGADRRGDAGRGSCSRSGSGGSCCRSSAGAILPATLRGFEAMNRRSPIGPRR